MAKAEEGVCDINELQYEYEFLTIWVYTLDLGLTPTPNQVLLISRKPCFRGPNRARSTPQTLYLNPFQVYVLTCAQNEHTQFGSHTYPKSSSLISRKRCFGGQNGGRSTPPNYIPPTTFNCTYWPVMKKIMLDLGPTTSQNQVCSYLENGASEGKTKPTRPPKPYTPTNLRPTHGPVMKKIKLDMDLGLTPTQN